MRRAALAGAALLLLTTAACGGGDPAPDPADAVPAKICGLFDRDRIEALGIPMADIRSRGQIADRQTRHDDTISCAVRDADSGSDAVLLRVVVADLDPDEVADETQRLQDEYDARDDGTCSQPQALSAVGSGYACEDDGTVRVDAVLPGRLVRATYVPVDDETEAVSYARVIGLMANLQENVVAYDRADESATPSPSS